MYYNIPVRQQKHQTVKFGEHIIFDAYGCPISKLNDPKLCIEVIDNLAKIAEMKKISVPYVMEASGNEVLGGKDPGGFSGFVIIQESHISIHTFAKRGFVTIDLYACKPFKHEGVVEYLINTFKPKNYDVIKMDRGLKYPTDNIYK